MSAKKLKTHMSGLVFERCQIDCPKHGKQTVMTWQGHKPSCPLCMQDEMKAEAQREQAERSQQNLEQCAIRGGVLPRFMGCTFRTYDVRNDRQDGVKTACMRYAQTFVQRHKQGDSLMLVGQTGTGKTHLATAIMLNVMSKGYTAQYVTAMDMFREVKSTFSNRNRSEAGVIDAFVRKDLLVIDEVAVHYGSDAENIILFDIIDKRYAHRKPTLLISNLPADEVKHVVGQRVFDRLSDGDSAVLACDWESHRSGHA